MKTIRTCNISRVIYNFKGWLLLKEFTVIRSFVTPALYGKLCLNEGDKVHVCYKPIHIVAFPKYFLQDIFHLSDSIHI